GGGGGGGGWAGGGQDGVHGEQVEQFGQVPGVPAGAFVQAARAFGDSPGCPLAAASRSRSSGVSPSRARCSPCSPSKICRHALDSPGLTVMSPGSESSPWRR